jgi:hypothetical protein
MAHLSRQAADDGRLIYVGNLTDDVRERYVLRVIFEASRFHSAS